MAAIANQRWISIRNIIIYLEAKFRPNWRIFVFWQLFWNQNGQHSKPTIDINSQHHNLLGNQISSKQQDFVFWRPNGHHSKPTMDINSQHHNLRRSQISSKSDDFFILAAILNQNGRHSKTKWSPYGAACLTSNRNYSAILATLQITSYALGV